MKYILMFVLLVTLALSSVGVDALLHPDCSFHSLSQGCK